MSVLGLDSGYTVKYNPLPSGVPSGTPSCKGLYLIEYPSSCPNTDTVYREIHKDPTKIKTYLAYTYLCDP